MAALYDGWLIPQSSEGTAASRHHLANCPERGPSALVLRLNRIRAERRAAMAPAAAAPAAAADPATAVSCR
ncbi:hypothetical protein CGL27_47000 [Streptomyces sp. 11-1-2]|nr:hypothetical protein CGL27_47000 [Streptomyces sp. 11-1-2]